jgi:hypothetical protein
VVFLQRGVERAHVFERHAFEVFESDDHVRHLHARVVDVVVHLDALAVGPEDADEGVADDGVAQVPDVRRLIRVDARVLDHPLGRVRGRGLPDCGREPCQQARAVVEEVEVAGARDLDAPDRLVRFEHLLQLLGDGARVALLAGRLLDALGQLEGDGEGEVAQLGARRHLGRDLFQFDPEFVGGGGADALAQRLLQFDQVQGVCSLWHFLGRCVCGARTLGKILRRKS